MRYLIIIAAVLALAGTAQATAPAKLSITPKRVDAGERFTLNARGFTPNASVTVSFAITGQAPYATYVPGSPTLADGSFSVTFVFAQCGNSPDALTLTLTDSFGVHDSASLTLC